MVWWHNKPSKLQVQNTSRLKLTFILKGCRDGKHHLSASLVKLKIDYSSIKQQWAARVAVYSPVSGVRWWQRTNTLNEKYFTLFRNSKRKRLVQTFAQGSTLPHKICPSSFSCHHHMDSCWSWRQITKSRQLQGLSDVQALLCYFQT